MPVILPSWLHVIASISLALALISAVVIAIDLLTGHRQHMWIMNVVWPVTALWAGPFALWAYFKVGRLSSHRAMHAAKARGEKPPAQTKPFPLSVLAGATHCGAGCTLGDLAAEWIVVAFPLALAGSTVAGTWTLDFALAFLLGVGFQFFTIAPMKGLPPGRGLLAAVKADTLSLLAWQIGMYGWMALVIFVWFGEIPKTDPAFWFMMQLAMFAGFATSYPANWWLLRRGIKEAM